MLGGNGSRLRRGFACGKTLVRRTRAAGQKAGMAFCDACIFFINTGQKKGTTKAVPFILGSAAQWAVALRNAATAAIRDSRPVAGNLPAARPWQTARRDRAEADGIGWGSEPG